MKYGQKTSSYIDELKALYRKGTKTAVQREIEYVTDEIKETAKNGKASVSFFVKPTGERAIRFADEVESHLIDLGLKSLRVKGFCGSCSRIVVSGWDGK